VIALAGLTALAKSIRQPNDRYRRNLADAVPFGEGPFTTRFADLRHRAVKVGGLLR
jgi:hypothetical protein